MDCWEKKRGDYGMCCVEAERLTALLADRPAKRGPDSFFTRAYEIRIRESGIGPSYSVLFDGDEVPTDITHFEHA